MKKVKDSNSIVIGWNRNREHKDLIVTFPRYKSRVPVPIKLHDLPWYLWRMIREIENSERALNK